MKVARIAILVASLALVGVIVDIVIAPRRARNEIRSLVLHDPTSSSFMRAAANTGHPVRQHVRVPLSAIAPIAACAVVFAEDATYFDHGTLDWESQRALLNRALVGDFSRGGSGLPQQLARNLFLNTDRTPQRKAKEYLLAYEISHTLSKDRLLELYLNFAEWGDGIWGIEAASQHYFGVSAGELTPAQATILASILPAPRAGWQFAFSASRVVSQENVLRRMWRARLLSDQDFGATMDRVREWRKQTRLLKSPHAGWRATTALMGAESPRPAANSARTLPLSTLCDTRRRGT